MHYHHVSYPGGGVIHWGLLQCGYEVRVKILDEWILYDFKTIKEEAQKVGEELLSKGHKEIRIKEVPI